MSSTPDVTPDLTPDLATALRDAVAAIYAPTTLADTLQRIVEVARDSLPDIDHVGITLLRRDGVMQTSAATDDLVLALDRLQYDLDDGPCVEAMRAGSPPVVVIEHARHDGRWHDFILPAVRLGLRAQMGVQLMVGDKPGGALNMYSLVSDTIGPETRQLAELFALHAGHAVASSRMAENLRAAIDTRQLIGQAVGIVMHQHGTDADTAFSYLVRVSATSETKLRLVAEAVVERGRT